jgi:sigma-B regulation protein RsbU (phosphoserine phosphatase)
VGGDYYDFEAEPNRVLMALGDVSGKGTGAALLMTVLRASVRAHWADANPAEAMARINRTVYQNTPPNKYITFFMAQLHPDGGRLAYVNAGHNPPLLVRQDGRLETLEEGGMALGLFEDAAYDEGSAMLEPGDVLVVFSDGVTETWNPQGDEFGEDGLGRVVVEARALEAAELERAVLRSLESFEAGAKATDDRTILVLKRDPA